MKEAIYVDLDGFYKEPVLVEDDVTGVFEVYEAPEATDEVPSPEVVLVGYRVAVPVPEGLFLPRFDMDAWNIFSAPVEYTTDEDGNSVPIPKPDVELWIEGKVIDVEAELQSAKEAKLSELDTLCNVAILSGFDYTIGDVSYHFSLSIPAQINFSATDASFKDGSITSEKWTVINNATGKVERVDLDQATFNAIKLIGTGIVKDNISKFRDTLEPQVWACTTIDEVKAIVW